MAPPDSYFMVYIGAPTLSPCISLWPLRRLWSWLRMVTFLPMRLSVILLPQSMWVPSMTMVFSISVLRAPVFDQVFHFLRFELFPFCFDDAAVCILLA